MATSYLFIPKMGSRWDLICSRIDLEKVLFSLLSILVGILWVEKFEGGQENVCDSSVKSPGIDRCLPNKSGFRF